MIRKILSIKIPLKSKWIRVTGILFPGMVIFPSKGISNSSEAKLYLIIMFMTVIKFPFISFQRQRRHKRLIISLKLQFIKANHVSYLLVEEWMVIS